MLWGESYAFNYVRGRELKIWGENYVTLGIHRLQYDLIGSVFTSTYKTDIKYESLLKETLSLAQTAHYSLREDLYSHLGHFRMWNQASSLLLFMSMAIFSNHVLMPIFLFGLMALF